MRKEYVDILENQRNKEKKRKNIEYQPGVVVSLINIKEGLHRRDLKETLGNKVIFIDFFPSMNCAHVQCNTALDAKNMVTQQLPEIQTALGPDTKATILEGKIINNKIKIKEVKFLKQK